MWTTVELLNRQQNPHHTSVGKVEGSKRGQNQEHRYNGHTGGVEWHELREAASENARCHEDLNEYAECEAHSGPACDARVCRVVDGSVIFAQGDLSSTWKQSYIIEE